MQQVNQLKAMRDDAWSRIKQTPDYKLASSLDALIADLEKALGMEPGTDTDSDSDPNPDSKGRDEEPFISPVDESEGNSGTDGSFRSDQLPPLNVADSDEAGAETRQEESSLLAQAEEAATDAAVDEDVDVMTELTQMIHAHRPEAPDVGQESVDEPETGSEHISVYETDVDESDHETSEAAARLAEEDAIVQAMKALDEDLSKSGIGLDFDEEIGEDPADEDTRS